MVHITVSLCEESRAGQVGPSPANCLLYPATLISKTHNQYIHLKIHKQGKHTNATYIVTMTLLCYNWLLCADCHKTHNQKSISQKVHERYVHAQD